MHLIGLLVIICATSHLLGPVFGRQCYDCKATRTQEKYGPCREFVESTTTKVECTDFCKTWVEDKSELGQGVWYKRSCEKKCVNEIGSTRDVSFEITCCQTDLCNGDKGKRPTQAPTTTTTTTQAPTTAAPGTGTTSQQTTTTGATGATEATGATDTTEAPTTTVAATTTVWKATTFVPPSEGQKCYECSSFLFGDSCDNDKVTSGQIDQVFCGGEIGSCGKIVSRIGFSWLGFDLSKSRGCTTLCKGKTEEVEHSIITDIYCCAGELCNGATPGLSRITWFHVIITIAAVYWMRV